MRLSLIISPLLCKMFGLCIFTQLLVVFATLFSASPPSSLSRRDQCDWIPRQYGFHSYVPVGQRNPIPGAELEVYRFDRDLLRNSKYFNLASNVANTTMGAYKAF